MKTRNVVIKQTITMDDGREIKSEHSNLNWVGWISILSDSGEDRGMMPYVNLALHIKDGSITVDGYDNIPQEARDLISAMLEVETLKEMNVISDEWKRNSER